MPNMLFPIIFNYGRELKDSPCLMSFIQIAYCITVPLFLLLSLFPSCRHFFMNALVVSNLLLVGYSMFLIRQLYALYQLARQLGFDTVKMEESVYLVDAIRLLLIIFLPFFSLIGRLQKNRLFSILLVFLLYWNNPVFTWNTFDLFSKIPAYFCLLCSGYALLWLLNKLPYQSTVV
jgi:hypothetical protein